MPYNPRDVFPGALPPKAVDLGAIVEAIDPSPDVPVVYYFGGGAPTAITHGGRMWLDAKFTGSVYSGLKGGVPGTANWPGRIFIEYSPTSWNPFAHDWNGQ